MVEGKRGRKRKSSEPVVVRAKRIWKSGMEALEFGNHRYVLQL